MSARCNRCGRPTAAPVNDGPYKPDSDRVQVAALGGYVAAIECVSCSERMLFHECVESQRECGHHCNHSWSHDECHWCGSQFGEQDVAYEVVPHVEQPAPVPSTGDVWQELIDAEPLSALREIYIARRALGLDRYGHILQRDNGRDHALDGQEELLDGIAYFTACGWYDVVASLRTALLCVIARRGAA